MVDFALRAFAFKIYFRDRSQAILDVVGREFKKNNKKLLKREKEYTTEGQII